jgi:hypothetical protein
MTFQHSTLQVLLDMFTYMRPADSQSEEDFIKKFLLPLPNARQDLAGNVIVRVGGEPGTDTFFPVMWSSHTDTVHWQSGRQKIYYTESGGRQVFLAKPTTNEKPESNCLGADCTAGVWLMREMINANVPGLYIFHAEEETGGYGSSYIASQTPELLQGIQYAIAFDRKGTSSVITHQFDRCASDDFANALAALLGDTWVADSGGIFTDTANYTELIGECTNISVGYEYAHSSKEWQDVDFLFMLRERMIKIAHQIPTTCPVVRKPGETDYAIDWRSTLKGYWSNPYSKYDNKLADDPVDEDDELFNLIVRDPDAVHAMLKDYGLTAEDIIPYQTKYKRSVRNG